MRASLLLTLALLLSGGAFSQSDSTSSLGDIARQSREAHKPAAASTLKKVLDNEDLERNKGPIPDITIAHVSNTPQIVDAILTYSRTHNEQETESAIRQWYDEQMHVAHAALEHSITLYQDRSSLTSANSLDRQRQYEDYRQYREGQNATQQRDLNDLKTIAYFQFVLNRVMSALRDVKNDLKLQKRYDFAWFETDYPQNRLIYMPNRPTYYQ